MHAIVEEMCDVFCSGHFEDGHMVLQWGTWNIGGPVLSMIWDNYHQGLPLRSLKTKQSV